MAVYGSDLGTAYDEIFRKSLLFHEGKLNANGSLRETQLLDECDRCSRYDVYLEDSWSYEFFLKQIEFARDICLRSEEQMRSERLGIYPAVFPKNSAFTVEKCTLGKGNCIIFHKFPKVKVIIFFV